MTTTITTEQMAALAIRVTIDTIDAIAAVADPVRRAGERAGHICKPILKEHFEQIDWQEALRIAVIGLVITAAAIYCFCLAIYRFCLWAGPALVRASAALGRWYARLLVGHEPTGDGPQQQEETQVSPPEATAPELEPEPELKPEPQPAATIAEPTPTPEPAPATEPAPVAAATRKPRRRTRRQASTAA